MAAREGNERTGGLSRRDFLKAAGWAGAMALAQKASAELPLPQTERRLQGAIDMHVHAAPDVSLRSLNDLELARRAKELGMAGVVIKNHEFITNDRAYLVRQVVPGIEVFGGIVLNHSVGGLNPVAVERMIGFTGGYGKVVWLPTFDAAHHRSCFGQGKEAGGIRVLDEGGRILPELKKIIQLVAQADIILATGHLSAAESLAVIQAALEVGVRRIIVTHALYSPGQMSFQEMARCAQMGAFIEHVYVACLAGPQAPLPWLRNWRHLSLKDYARAIATVGAERSILCSDLGQYLNPTPADGMQAFVQGLWEEGIGQEQIDWMLKKNPARLLGLEPL